MSAVATELAGIPLFSSLSPSDLEELATWFEAKTVSEGVVLTGEGAPGYSFFVLLAGEAVVRSNDIALSELGPGDFFGEMAILGDGQRNATVATTAPSRVLVMFGTEFRRLQQAHPDVANRLEAAASERRDAS